jgi:hypothetical protein
METDQSLQSQQVLAGLRDSEGELSGIIFWGVIF